MIESIHIAWLLAFGLLSVVFGGVAGFLWAKIRVHNRAEELDDIERSLRFKQIEADRVSYQDSTSKINKIADGEPHEVLALRELLNQKEHDFSLLKEETELEARVLNEQIQSLKTGITELKKTTFRGEQAIEPGQFEDVVVTNKTESMPGSKPDPELRSEPILSSSDETESLESTDTDVADPTDPTDQSDQSDRSDQPDQPDRSDQPDQPDQPDHLVTTGDDISTVESIETVLDDQPEYNPVHETQIEGFEFHWTPPPSDVEVVGTSGLPAFQSVSAFVPITKQEDTSQNSKPVLPSVNPDKKNLVETAERPEKTDPGQSSDQITWPVQTFKPWPEIVSTEAPQRVVSRPKTEARKSSAPTPNRSSLPTIPGLGPDQFELLQDLGYATPEKIASLTAAEITRLSAIFRIPESQIQSAWIPAAKQRLGRT